MSAAAPAHLKALLQDFEPLGEDPSFGHVQRLAGVAGAALLRFAVIGAAPLAALLETDFAGLGDPEATRLILPEQADYLLHDTRSGLVLHTFAGPPHVTPEPFLAECCRRLPALAAALLERWRAGPRLFVHTSREGISAELRARLEAALARHGEATLLLVEQSDDPGRVGRAERLGPRLLRGAVERLGTADPPRDSWAALCRAAHALWRAATLPAPPSVPDAVPDPVAAPAEAAPTDTVDEAAADAAVLDRVRAAREAGGAEAAERVLLEAIVAAPHSPAFLEEWCHLAHARFDWAAAADRWSVLRARFPDRPEGWLHGVAALREAGRLDTAAEVIAEAVARFPGHAELAAERLRIAVARRESAQIWPLVSALLTGWPEHEAAYLAAADALLAQGDPFSADLVLRLGQDRVPASAALKARVAGIVPVAGPREVILPTELAPPP